MKFPFLLDAKKKFDAVGFGTNAVDYLIVVPKYPQFDSKIHLTEYLQAAGGQIASAMVGITRLGAKTAYIGRFGTDKEGDFGLETLKKEGVNTSYCEKIEDSRTQIAFILIEEKTGERTIIWNRDEKLAYQPEDVPLESASQTKILHLDAHDAFSAARLAKTAKDAGAIISLDIDNLEAGLDELLPLVDILISSNDFPHKLTNLADERNALLEIQKRYGCAIVGKTKGKKGGLLYCDGMFLSAKAYDVPNGCKDTTGAGDAFHAGFLYGLLTGEEIEIALKMANAVASLKCRELGARTALPNLEEVKRLIKK